MNLIVIPFHDWRKSESEGFRTRDVHLINAFAKLPQVEKVLVVNRPLTWLELYYKKYNRELQGKRVIRQKKFELTEINEKLFVADCFSNDWLGALKDRQKWFFKAYGNAQYQEFLSQCLAHLGMDNPVLVTQNVFAYQLSTRFPVKRKLFDAWDNFMKFPAYTSIRPELKKAYLSSGEHIDRWTTNSVENQGLFAEEYNVKRIEVIKNGLNISFVNSDLPKPKDLSEIPGPIIGFGGKLSYLVDVELVNKITADHPEASFVFVGQILAKDVYANIIKRPNVHFLGDKHYSEYPAYVKSFDICIVPYRINEGQHGGDSLKAYEYLSTGKKVVGTNGNGLQDLHEYLYLGMNPQEFSDMLKNTENEKPMLNLEPHLWATKATTIIELMHETEEVPAV